MSFQFFLLRVYGRKGVEVHEQAIKERCQYPAILTEIRFITWKMNTTFFPGTAGNPELERQRHLPRSANQSRRRSRFTYPAQNSPGLCCSKAG